MSLSLPAGHKILGSELLQLTTMYNGLAQSTNAACNLTAAVGTVAASVSGTSITVSVSGANSYALCSWVAAFACTSAAAGNLVEAILGVDGGLLSHPIASTDLNATYTSRTCTAFAKVALAAGSHTLQLLAVRSAGGGANVLINDTSLTVTLIDLV